MRSIASADETNCALRPNVALPRALVDAGKELKRMVDTSTVEAYVCIKVSCSTSLPTPGTFASEGRLVTGPSLVLV